MITPKVNLELYKSFIAVYSSKSMTHAATNLHVDRTAISKHIKELEAELKVELFNRHKKGVTATPDGERLYQRISNFAR